MSTILNMDNMPKWYTQLINKYEELGEEYIRLMGERTKEACEKMEVVHFQKLDVLAKIRTGIESMK